MTAGVLAIQFQVSQLGDRSLDRDLANQIITGWLILGERSIHRACAVSLPRLINVNKSLSAQSALRSTVAGLDFSDFTNSF